MSAVEATHVEALANQQSLQCVFIIVYRIQFQAVPAKLINRQEDPVSVHSILVLFAPVMSVGHPCFTTNMEAACNAPSPGLVNLNSCALLQESTDDSDNDLPELYDATSDSGSDKTNTVQD